MTAGCIVLTNEVPYDTIKAACSAAGPLLRAVIRGDAACVFAPGWRPWARVCAHDKAVGCCCCMTLDARRLALAAR